MGGHRPQGCGAPWGVIDRSKCQGDPGPESGDGVSIQHQPLEGSILCVHRHVHIFCIYFAYILPEYCSPDPHKRRNCTGPSVPLMVCDGCFLSVPICVDSSLSIYICMYVCMHSVCVPTGNTCSALLPDGPGDSVLQQPHVYHTTRFKNVQRCPIISM